MPVEVFDLRRKAVGAAKAALSRSATMLITMNLGDQDPTATKRIGSIPESQQARPRRCLAWMVSARTAAIRSLASCQEFIAKLALSVSRVCLARSGGLTRTRRSGRA